MNNYEYFWKTIRIPYPLEKTIWKKERSRCNLERERERFRNVTRTNFASSPRRWGKLKFPLPLRPIYHGKLFNEVSHRVSRAWKVPLAGRLWYRDGETASSLALETGTGTGERERGYAIRDMGEVRIKRKRRCFDINERVKVGAN